MGTSSSSSGSPSKKPMVPPWAQDPALPSSDDVHSPDGDTPDKEVLEPPSSVPIAPPGRFGVARTLLGRFACNGSTDDLKQGVGSYIHKGLGGSGIAVRRFGVTAHTAGKLFHELSIDDNQKTNTESDLDPSVLVGSTTDEVISAVVEAVRPIDGTQDGEASRASISNALAELFEQYQDPDLLNLSEEQRLFVVECFISWDVFQRFMLDLGKHIQEKAPTYERALSCFDEVKDFIKETIAAEFRKLVDNKNNLTGSKITTIVRKALKLAFEVFEEECQ